MNYHLNKNVFLTPKKLGLIAKKDQQLTHCFHFHHMVYLNTQVIYNTLQQNVTNKTSQETDKCSIM